MSAFVKLICRHHNFYKQTSISTRFYGNSEVKSSKISSKMQTSSFSFLDYDCIGFDLDNTLCHYNIQNLVKLEYNVLANFLINEKNYHPSILSEPLEKDLDFMQKGLALDVQRGNVLKLNHQGLVQQVSHGRKFLSESEILACYGPIKEWDVAALYAKDMLQAWNGPLSEKIRMILDYFDLPASVCFARCVDTIENGSQKSIKDIWPDILEGLIYMFSRNHFSQDVGGFFPRLKKDPSLYYNKCNGNIVHWLKTLKKENKFTFLVTGSNADYAKLTASYCLGSDWKELFDVIIFYSRKPGFFVGERDFYKVIGDEEDDNIEMENLKLGNGVCYSQGNWDTLYGIMAQQLGMAKPKCVYVGDNLLQDIYTPNKYNKCETVAVVEEMFAEGVNGNLLAHKDGDFITSSQWGSFFSSIDSEGHTVPTYWCEIIRKHAKICVPSLEIVASLPFDHKFPIFTKEKFCNGGFYPGPPLALTF